MTGSDAAPVRLDTSRPHPARVYDWWLGGKDNYPVDEELARRILAADGTAVRGARANRRFMHRAVRAAAEAGVRQFLDIGTGIPTEPNLHQVAQRVAPESKVVYADNDPIVLRHADLAAEFGRGQHGLRARRRPRSRRHPATGRGVPGPRPPGLAVPGGA